MAWGLPITKLVFNASAACTIGALVLALFALRRKENAFRMALDLAGISAAVWTAAASVMSFLTFNSLGIWSWTTKPGPSRQITAVRADSSRGGTATSTVRTS